MALGIHGLHTEFSWKKPIGYRRDGRPRGIRQRLNLREMCYGCRRYRLVLKSLNKRTQVCSYPINTREEIVLT